MLEGLNVSKQEGHLIKGVSPIFAFIMTARDFRNAEGYYNELEFEREFRKNFGKLGKVHNVDFSDDTVDLDKQNFLHAGYKTYVISTVDDYNKFSEGLNNCTSLVVAGIDKRTGENISFLTHQNPEEFLGYNNKEDIKAKFIKHLKQRLNEIKKRCKQGTIDAVIVGGKYFTNFHDIIFAPEMNPNYLGSIKLLGVEVKKSLDFEPIVINGPKALGPDDVFYDNKKRKLYFIRQKITQTNAPLLADFPASDVDRNDNNEHKWKKLE